MSIELTEEMVELAAEAIDDAGLWPRYDEDIQEFKARVARAALTAALAIEPTHEQQMDSFAEHG